MTDLIEAMAFALWKADADRAAPNVGKDRTLEGFRDLLEKEQQKWIGLATAAYQALRNTLVPAGWLCEHPAAAVTFLTEQLRGQVLKSRVGWTETTLFPLPELPHDQA